MKNVLFISYNYPPIVDVGMIRTLKFTKYLPKFGWKPYVISVKNPDVWRVIGDERIPNGVNVYYTRNLVRIDILANIIRKIVKGKKSVAEKFGLGTRSVVVPDFQIGWALTAFVKGKRIIKKEKIDAIVTGMPYTSMVVGAMLKAHTGVPLVVNFEDPWTLNPESIYRNRILEQIDKGLERFVIENADRVIFVTKSNEREHIRIYPALKEKSTVLYCGFDLEDIPDRIEPFEKFTLTHTGSFYYKRTPESLLKAVSQLLENNSIDKNKFQILLVGKKDDIVTDAIARYSVTLGDILVTTGFVPLKNAIEYVRKSHLLFLVLADHHRLIIPDKVFGYLAAGKPILALIPDGECADFLRDYSDNSYIISSKNITDIKDAILQCYNKWLSGAETQYKKLEEVRKLFNHEYETRQLVHILEELT